MSLELAEIELVVKDVIARSKDYITKKAQGKWDKFNKQGQINLPDYYPNYRTAVEQHEAISYHAEHGKFPDRLFLLSAPNQEKKEFDYVKSIYKQQTLPVYLDLLSTLQRPLNDKNWSIEYKDEDLKKYVSEELKYYGSLENFFKFVVPNVKTMDAEGVLVVKPSYVETKEDGSMDESKSVAPCPYYYESWQIVSQQHEKYYMLETVEKSIVEYGNVKKQIGMVYEFYDDTAIYKIIQVGKFTDFTFEIVPYFTHSWGRIPVHKLMGVPVVKSSTMYWQSPFLFVTDILDNVAINLTYLQVSIRNCVYPYKIMVGDVCEFEDPESKQCCQGGKIWKLNPDDPNNGYFTTCPSCKGYGLKNRMSPGGTMLLKPKTREDDGDSTFSQPPLQYVSPDTSSLTFIEEKCDKDLLKAREILHMKTSSSETKGSENLTATGKVLDQKAQFAFIQWQIQQLFVLWEFAIDAIGWMRYGAKYQKPTINPPQSYDFVTEEDVMAQLAEASKLGLPPFMLAVYIERYLRSMYFNENQTGQLLDLILKADRLLGLTNDDIRIKQAGGLIQDYEIVLHDSGLAFIRELAKDESFFKKTFEEQKTALYDMAKAKADEIKAAKKAANIADVIPAA